jgi:Astacin (Peptidase family M12A)
MAVLTGKKWANGRRISVRFLDGTKKQKSQTQKFAEPWSEHANITFKFGTDANAETRISFKEIGSWSALGTDCTMFPKGKATMNYGWLKDHSAEEEWRRVVLHEFGHALGAIHEHQNPAGGIQWNAKEVYRVFSGPPNNWDKAKIDFNIIQKFSIDQLNGTTFDPDSIMLYAFPANLMVGGKATKSNTSLSGQDKQFIGSLYPKVAAGMRRRGVAAAAASAATLSTRTLTPADLHAAFARL